MQKWLLRLICLVVGALFSLSLGSMWAVIPFFISVAVVLVEWQGRPERIRVWAPVLVGLGVGLLVASLAAFVLSSLLPSDSAVFRPLTASLATLLATAGIVAFHHRGDLPFFSSRHLSATRATDAVRILDTSVIIDGRVANISRAGFIEGDIVIPRFILKELQYIADSADTLRRNKGRRGLEILNELRANPDLTVRLVEENFPEIPDVDAKLVALAKSLHGKILTNDYNLKTIAELQGVEVLNVNELANAVKPEIIQGEVMSVRVIREGKEPAQGIAYLDDGTMVVVDNGKYSMNQTLSVEVTSVLQTSAGRMIFARIRDENPRYEKYEKVER